MENQRQDYRHTFEPAERLHVEVFVPGKEVKLEGKAVNLSVGGVALACAGAEALQPADRCMLRFSLRQDRAPLELPAAVVHARAGAELCYGLRFLPLVDPKREEARDRVLWAYLLEEQRRPRRESVRGIPAASFQFPHAGQKFAQALG